MENSHKRQIVSPAELVKNWYGRELPEYIVYDPGLKDRDRDYWRIVQSGHDGTMAFTVELLGKLLNPLINRESYCIEHEIDADRLIGIKYTVGNIRWSQCFGMVDLAAGRYPGQRERMRMPVKCEYIYEDAISIG